MKSLPPRNRDNGPHSSGRHPVRFRVMLLNPANLDLGFIIRTVMELTHYAKAEATHRMWEAVYFGRSIVLVTHFERAELYIEQFRERGLNVELEPA